MVEGEKPTAWRRRLTRAAILYLLVPYLTVTVIFVMIQRRLMYSPTVAASLRVRDLELDPKQFSDLQLETADGETLNGWLINGSVDSADDVKKLVIYFPGNSLNRYERIEDLLEISRCGFDVMIFDYRGFGDSTGRPSETALSSDACLIWDHAQKKLGYHSNNIVLFGESLGGAVALSLWSDDSPVKAVPHRLILSSTFASMPRTVGNLYPWFPFRFFVLDRWPSIDRISKVTAPITVFHGTADEMIPMSEAIALSKAAGSNATLLAISEASHNEIPTQQLSAELVRCQPFVDELKPEAQAKEPE